MINRNDDVSNEMYFDPEVLARKNQKLIFGDDEGEEDDFHLYLSESDEEKTESNRDKKQCQDSPPFSEPTTSSEVTTLFFSLHLKVLNVKN